MMRKIILVVVLGLCSCSSNKDMDLSILSDYLYLKIYSQNSSKENLIKSIVNDPINLKNTIAICAFYDSMFVDDGIKDTLHMNKIANQLIPYKQLSTFKICEYTYDAESENVKDRFFYHAVAVLLDNKTCMELTFILIKKKWYFYYLDIMSNDDANWSEYEDCFKEK